MNKVKITAKEDSAKVFNAPINPTKYSLAFKNEYNSEKASGSILDNLKYESTQSPELDLEFLLDGTGVTQQNTGNKLINKIIKNDPFKKDSVSEQLKKFLNTTGTYDGKIHKPHIVTISWGTLNFEGVLLDLVVDYSLFSENGAPLRAILKTKFRGTVTQIEEALIKNNSSPDLTHKRTVQDGETLPLMTEKIYGDSKYYLEVAKINGLINFRQLKPGTELYFPPIEKVS
ncbi:LysM peptidoglycan-binding domain-containing protein [Chryseobacterium sp. RG1]|uniref:LysM peptidoglycan-binding domain-containing protein n=1 Tax=Chryseobacterium tagetis TaxID=2801334 RepID=A0ABS8A3A6_9FLAO|nr:LysM peptidoglycan-binding domain-containing protein [Chryseobacterium tagetis]MCA6067892.1 LysM peptidoglycan-binding domain-containing protein [Chryseobacterium tagetis]